VVFLSFHATATWVADREVELSQLGVSPSARRSGAGRALLRGCERRARELDADAIVLWSGPAHRAAHALYESLGYTRVPERDGETVHGRRLIYRLALR
jgi:ribosomal protein S18 acetylase RimI-like enzyme